MALTRRVMLGRADVAIGSWWQPPMSAPAPLAADDPGLVRPVERLHRGPDQNPSTTVVCDGTDRFDSSTNGSRSLGKSARLPAILPNSRHGGASGRRR